MRPQTSYKNGEYVSVLDNLRGMAGNGSDNQ